MSETAGSEGVTERLHALEGKLDLLVRRENERRWREDRLAARAFLTAGLICVQGDEDDLQSAGVNLDSEGVVFDWGFKEHERALCDQDAEKLWEIKGDGCGGCYGYLWGRTIGARMRHECYYLSPEQAVRVNAIRAKKYLEQGGSVEEAKQKEGGWRFDRNFIAAVRADARSRGAAPARGETESDKHGSEVNGKPGGEAAPRALLDFLGAALIYQGVVGFVYSRRMFAAISAFLILTALCVILGGELADALATGLVGWVVTTVVLWLWYRKGIRALERVVNDRADAAGIGDSIPDSGLNAFLRY